MNFLKKYKHVIWDWNGTILDDLDMCIDIMNNLLETQKLPLIDTNKYKEVFTITVKNYYKALGVDFSQKSFLVIGKEWMDNYESRKYKDATLHSSALGLIKHLSETGISQSILSAYPQDTLEELVNHHKLNDFFDYLVGADDIYAYGKFEQGKKLMNQLSLEKSEAVLIGDTIHDYEVAEEIGIDCILTSEGHQSINRLKTTGCKVVSSIDELLM